MNSLEPADITRLLTAWAHGEEQALEQLMPLVYHQLHAQARRYMRGERSGATLQTTALVHELFLRLVGSKDLECLDRGHFLALSARMMRRILVDKARARTAAKRGGRIARSEHSSAPDLDQIATIESEGASSLCALDDALEGLARIDARRPSHRVALLWRIERRGDGAGSGCTDAADSHARLAARQGMARAGATRRVNRRSTLCLPICTAFLIALAVGQFGQAAPSPSIVSVARIWDAGARDAFTDLIRWRDHWYCTFREGDAHVGGDGRLRVLDSTDGKKWKSAALVRETGVDLRDPKLSITPDDRLMITAGGSVYDGTPDLGRQPRVMFSKDGPSGRPRSGS